MLRNVEYHVYLSFFQNFSNALSISCDHKMYMTKWLHLKHRLLEHWDQTDVKKIKTQKHKKQYFSHLFWKHKIPFEIHDAFFFFISIWLHRAAQKKGLFIRSLQGIWMFWEQQTSSFFFLCRFTWSKFCARLFCKIPGAVLLWVSGKAPVHPECFFFFFPSPWGQKHQVCVPAFRWSTTLVSFTLFSLNLNLNRTPSSWLLGTRPMAGAVHQ